MGAGARQIGAGSYGIHSILGRGAVMHGHRQPRRPMPGQCCRLIRRRAAPVTRTVRGREGGHVGKRDNAGQTQRPDSLTTALHQHMPRPLPPRAAAGPTASWPGAVHARPGLLRQRFHQIGAMPAGRDFVTAPELIAPVRPDAGRAGGRGAGAHWHRRSLGVWRRLGALALQLLDALGDRCSATPSSICRAACAPASRPG